MRYLILALIISTLISCQDSTPPEDAQLGKVEMPVTGDEKAIPHFERGLLLLHNFEYEDGRKSFEKAKEIDPDMVMAYWGIAMTYNHPLWSAQFTDEGREILNDLAPTPEERVALAQTDLERDLIRAVNVLYDESVTDKLDRDVAYCEYMKDMYARYDGNQEVAAFYALSVLGSEPERNPDTYGKGAVVVKGILAENPNHPGALHYLIHSYDDPEHAHLALDAANSYSKVAADAGHALHMPSHIYVALGMWDEVISSNIASFNASDERRKRLQLEPDARNYHALEWLMYGYLQKGVTDTAKILLDNMITYFREKPSPGARGYAVQMIGGYLANTGDWADPVATTEIDVDDLNISLRSGYEYIKAMHAYTSGDLATVAQIIDTLEHWRNEEGKLLMQRGAKMCSGVSWYNQLPTQTDINQANIMEIELRAILAEANNDMEAADKLYREAVDLETSTSYMYGPPVVVKPSFELYAEFLHEMGKYEEALVMVDLALEKTPGRLIDVKLKSELEQKLSAI